MPDFPQIIYIGNENPESILTGKIAGIANFNEVVPNQTMPKWLLILSGIVPFLIGWWGDKIFPILRSERKINIFWKLLIVAILGASLSFIIQFIGRTFFITIPPF